MYNYCAYCGKKLELTNEVSYCSECFENRGNSHDQQRVSRERGGKRNEGGNVSNAQLEKINETLEKILMVLETKPEPKNKPKRKPKKY